MKTAQKIFFDNEDHSFMIDYKKTTGVSIQRFVTEAIKEKINRMDIEQTIKDQELLKQ